MKVQQSDFKLLRHESLLYHLTTYVILANDLAFYGGNNETYRAIVKIKWQPMKSALTFSK